MGSSRLQAKRLLRARRDTVKTEATAAEKDWHRKYTNANNGCRDAPLSMTRLLFRGPALFTRSCRFHYALSTTSSATRATKSLQ
jgi:hypothetical protein